MYVFVIYRNRISTVEFQPSPAKPSTVMHSSAQKDKYVNIPLKETIQCNHNKLPGDVLAPNSLPVFFVAE